MRHLGGQSPNSSRWSRSRNRSRRSRVAWPEHLIGTAKDGPRCRAVSRLATAQCVSCGGRKAPNQSAVVGTAVRSSVPPWSWSRDSARAMLGRGSQRGQIAHGSVEWRTRGPRSRMHVHGAFSASNQKGARRNNVGMAHLQVDALRLAFAVAATGDCGRGTSAKACLHRFLIQSMCPADRVRDRLGRLRISVIAPAWNSQWHRGSPAMRDLHVGTLVVVDQQDGRSIPVPWLPAVNASKSESATRSPDANEDPLRPEYTREEAAARATDHD